jgi:hypothetical protein
MDVCEAVENYRKRSLKMDESSGKEDIGIRIGAPVTI